MRPRCSANAADRPPERGSLSAGRLSSITAVNTPCISVCAQHRHPLAGVGVAWRNRPKRASRRSYAPVFRGSECRPIKSPNCERDLRSPSGGYLGLRGWFLVSAHVGGGDRIRAKDFSLGKNPGGPEANKVKSNAGPTDLAQVVDAWERLPAAVRAGILAMIAASGGNARQRGVRRRQGSLNA